MTVFALSACKSESIADRDVLEVSEDSNEIIWGVKKMILAYLA